MKRVVADQALDIQVLKDVLGGEESLTIEQRQTIVRDVALTAGRQRRACRWLGVHRSAVRYRAHRRGGRSWCGPACRSRRRVGRTMGDGCRARHVREQHGVSESHRHGHAHAGVADDRGGRELARRSRRGVLDAVAQVRGYPETIRVDNGSECQSRALNAWAYAH